MSGFPSKNVIVFIDDILIKSESFQEHLVLVNDVLRKLEEVGVKMKVGKCECLRMNSKFWGIRLTQLGYERLISVLRK